jgi:hypothetical protein
MHGTFEKIDTKADPLTIESLIAWLETMPANKRYEYEICNGKCLYGLYMASHGIAWGESGACSTLDSGQERADFCAMVYEHVAVQRPWTFGAALDRAKTALAS